MSSFILAFVLATAPTTLALPVSPTLHKRVDLSPGATAGLAIGIALLALFLLAAIIFIIYNWQRQKHNGALERERAILAGEKNADGTDKVDRFAPPPPPPTGLKRNKSVKDHLMGPLYRGSTIEMPQMAAQRGGAMAGDAHWEGIDDQPLVHKPWAESSPRPSFSSKRGTRMMMLM